MTNENPSPQKKKKRNNNITKPKSAMDRISDLPDHLAHRILSSLPSAADSARTRLLSRHWNRLAGSFPFLQFRQSHSFRTSIPFSAFVHRTLSKFLSLNLHIERLLLETSVREPELPSLLDHWIESALKNGVRELILAIDPGNDHNIYYHFPETDAFRDFPMFRSLRKLFLSRVTIADGPLRDVVSLCREISHIRLVHCRGFETLALRGLENLEIVEVAPPRDAPLRRVEIADAPSLRGFSFRPCERSSDCTVGLASCPNLRELSLSNCDLVTDEWLRCHVQTFPLLEDLEIVDCHEMRRVRVFAERLRRFRILGCDNVVAIELDAPSLSEFRLQGYEIPVLSTKNVDFRCDFDVNFLYRSNDPADSSWFLKLREFLEMSNNNNNINYYSQRKVTLELGFYGNKVTFDREELREVKIPQPHKVEELVLCLGTKATSVDCGDLIDGLLWSCHPKRMSIDTYSALQESTTKVLGEKLFDGERSNYCCDSCSAKCWRHDLKSAKIAIVSNKEEDNEILISLKTLLKKLPSIGRDNYKVFFQLDWNSCNL